MNASLTDAAGGMNGDGKVVIIGGGVAGLSCGCYLQMNGYHTEILEMNRDPGGLCVAWDRGPYVFDGCLRWLTGTHPSSMFHKMWTELGVLQGRKLFNHGEFYRIEGHDGKHASLPANLDGLERELIRIAPEDEGRIRKLIRLARRCAPLDPPERPLELLSLRQKMHLFLRFAPILLLIPRWKDRGVVDYINTFQNPFLREVLASLAGDPRMSAIVLIMVIAIRCGPNAGFISGGSRGLSEAIARRYTKLGGMIHYDTSAEEISIEQDRATAVRCSNGKVFPAGTVISCADGYTTLFKWLRGRYLNKHIRYAYDKGEVFPGLIQVSLGVGAEFPEAPPSFLLGLKNPLRPDDKTVVDRFEVAVFGSDSEFCPAGKSVFLVRFCTEYDFWTNLKARSLADYKKAKAHLLRDVIEALDARFPGLSKHVEQTDICSPASYERWTGNWKGSYQGWLPTPGIIGRRLPRRVPGLSNFYMAGHWVEPGGGLPPAALSGRYVAQIICERDGKRFVSSAA